MDFKLIFLFEFGLFIILFALIKPRNFILLYFLIKPAVDWFAESGTTFMGIYIGPQYLAGIVVPILLVFYVFINRKDISLFPIKRLLMTFVAVNIYDYISGGNYSIDSFGWLVRVIFPLCLYISLPHIVKERSDILIFIKMIALSGIFPLTVGFLQLAGFIPYVRLPESFGELDLQRLTGGYNDAFSFSFPIILAIFSILFLIQYRSEEEGTKRGNNLYGILLTLYISILFFSYHRLVFICFVVTIFLWSIYNKRRKLVLLLTASIILSLPFTFNNLMEFFGDVYKPFLSSPHYSNMPVEKAFHGRWGIWESQLSHFSNYSFSEKLLGKGISARYSHNDFIRILVSNGIIGLMLYILILGFIGRRIFQLRRFYSKGENEFMYQLSIICQLIFIVYVLGSFTLTISLLSSPTWFLWSFFGILVYQHRKIIIEKNRNSKPKAKVLATRKSD